MYRETVHDTEELLLKEMEKINSKGEISSTDLCNIKYASQALMNLETYEAMKEYGEDASFSMGRRSLPHEESWRRGRGADGRFVSRAPYPESYRDEYSMRRYEDGYSGHSIEDRTIELLEHQMDNAKSEYDRKFIEGQIRAIREKQMK